jgi:hypothetical protein
MNDLQIIETVLKILQSFIISTGVIVGFFTWKSHLLKERKYEVARKLFQSVIAVKTQLNNG